MSVATRAYTYTFPVPITPRTYREVSLPDRSHIADMFNASKKAIEIKTVEPKIPEVPEVKKSRFICTICGSSFRHSGNVPRHNRIHTGEKPYRCKYNGCNAIFKRSDELTVHNRMHTGEMPFKCTYKGCTAAYKLSGNLKNHMRIHTGEKPYKCNYEGCGVSFTQSHNLSRHIRSHMAS